MGFHGFSWRLTLAAIGIVAAAASAGVSAQQALPERDLKAQIVTRALLFVEWSADALPSGTSIVICVADSLPVADALERLGGQVVNGRKLEIRRLSGPVPAACQVAVVGLSALAALAGPKPRPRGVFVVCDAPGALDAGAMLSLQTDQDRIVFDVNLTATRQAGMDINSRLLRLARFVRYD